MMYVQLKPILFSLFLIAMVGGFIGSVWRLVRLARLGQDQQSPLSDLVDRIGAVIYLAFFQRRVVRETFGWNHVIIFWSFMIITVGHIEFIVRGVYPPFSMSFVGPTLYHIILAGEDFMAFLVLFAIALALFRRIVIRPNYIHYTSKEGFIVLSLIGMVMITYFGAMGFGIVAKEPSVLSHADHIYVSSQVALIFDGVDPKVAYVISESFWWAHAVILLGFLNFIPHSKHIHLLGAIPNIFFHKREKHKAALTRLNFEDENAERFGVGLVADFTWKALLDTYACTECGRCDKYCPARRTGKALEPQQLMHDIRKNLYINGDELLKSRGQFEVGPAAADWEPSLSLIAETEADRKAGQTSQEVLWGCTNCGACVQACPVLIDHVDAIMDMRRYLTLTEGAVSPELSNTMSNIERNYNPWGIGADKRGDWVESLGLKVWEQSQDSEQYEYLFWVGCAGSFDNASQKTTKALSEILTAANISYAVLGKNEKCTADPARRAGNEYLFEEMALSNTTLLNELGVKKVVTACPHCFNTLKNEYPAFGGKYEVIHHSQLIAELLENQRIEVTEAALKQVTYHDPCFLGRWNDEVEAPRKSLAALKHLKVVEMAEHGKKSMCCGAGGAQMWMEEQHGSARVNVVRTEQALEVKPEAIVVGCPFCKTMISDGAKHLGHESLPVVDIAEVVAEALVK